MQEKAIRIVWDSEEITAPVYANQIIVSHAGGTEFNELIQGFKKSDSAS